MADYSQEQQHPEQHPDNVVEYIKKEVYKTEEKNISSDDDDIQEDLEEVAYIKKTETIERLAVNETKIDQIQNDVAELKSAQNSIKEELFKQNVHHENVEKTLKKIEENQEKTEAFTNVFQFLIKNAKPIILLIVAILTGAGFEQIISTIIGMF